MRDVGSATAAPIRRPEKVPAKVYGIMALTTVLTFATLTTSYQLFFEPQLVAPEVAASS